MKKSKKNIQSSFNSQMASHILLGVGLGILLTYPVVGSHPLRWGIGLLALGVVLYLYPQFAKK